MHRNRKTHRDRGIDRKTKQTDGERKRKKNDRNVEKLIGL